MHEHFLLGAGGAGLSNAEGELAANEDDDARWPGSGAAIEQDARPRRANSVTAGCCAADAGEQCPMVGSGRQARARAVRQSRSIEAVRCSCRAEVDTAFAFPFPQL